MAATLYFPKILTTEQKQKQEQEIEERKKIGFFAYIKNQHGKIFTADDVRGNFRAARFELLRTINKSEIHPDIKTLVKQLIEEINSAVFGSHSNKSVKLFTDVLKQTNILISNPNSVVENANNYNKLTNKVEQENPDQKIIIGKMLMILMLSLAVGGLLAGAVVPPSFAIFAATAVCLAIAFVVLSKTAHTINKSNSKHKKVAHSMFDLSQKSSSSSKENQKVTSPKPSPFTRKIIQI